MPNNTFLLVKASFTNPAVTQGMSLWKFINNEQPKCFKEKFPLKINEAVNNANNNKIIICMKELQLEKDVCLTNGIKCGI